MHMSVRDGTLTLDMQMELSSTLHCFAAPRYVGISGPSLKPSAVQAKPESCCGSPAEAHQGICHCSWLLWQLRVCHPATAGLGEPCAYCMNIHSCALLRRDHAIATACHDSKLLDALCMSQSCARWRLNVHKEHAFTTLVFVLLTALVAYTG